MEKSKFLYGALGFLALGLASCSSDDLGVKAPEVVSEDQSRFMAVTLSAPSEVTSRTFENGTAHESYVYCLDFIFYDVNGNPTGTPAHLGEEAIKGLTFTENPDGNNVTRMCTSVVPVQLSQGDNLPAQVICIVNGNVDVVNQISSKPLNTEDGDGFRDIVQQEFSREGNFLMTNSVYFGQDQLTGQSNQRLSATPINANTQLFGTRGEAQSAIENNSASALVDIYVERVAAKVTLSLNAENIEVYTLDNGDEANTKVSIKFVPEYWLMNAVDKKTYLTKRYGIDDNGTINMGPDYSEINGALTAAGFSNWNDEPNHRSYWGTSTSYFKNLFPLVSDQVFDPEANEGVTYDPYTNDAYPVNYFSYNSVVAGINNTTYSEVRKQWKAADNGNFDASVIYTRETTTPKVTINNDGTNGNPAAAVGSAVVLGHYVVGDDAVKKTFYIDRNNGDNGTFYGSEASARNALLERQTIVFLDEAGQNPVDVTDSEGNTIIDQAVLDAFAVKHPVAAVRGKLANSNIAGRLVTLQLKSVPASVPLYYYDNIVGDYVRINAGNLNDVNSQLVSTGYFDIFHEGLGFFTIPVRHLNFKTNSYTANENGGGTYNWKAMSVGELGIVRNHAYTITVSSIKGLANGLRSYDQPIVPAKDAVNQYIAMRLNILSWNVVNGWSVDL